MDTLIRRKLAMAVRVLDFAGQHPSTDVSFTGLITRLESSVARLQALSIAEDAGHAGENRASSTRRNARRNMLRKLRHLSRVAALADLDQPLAQSFVAPKARSPQLVVSTAARRMLAEATAQKELFLKYGMGETFLDRFAQTVAAFDASTAGVHVGRGQHVSALAELKGLMSECMMVVGALDGVVRELYDDDSGALGAWVSARNVFGPTHKAPPEPGPTGQAAA